MGPKGEHTFVVILPESLADMTLFTLQHKFMQGVQILLTILLRLEPGLQGFPFLEA